MAQEQEFQPMAKEPELQPIVEEPKLQPVAEKPALKSTTEEPELSQSVEQPKENSVKAGTQKDPAAGIKSDSSFKSIASGQDTKKDNVSVTSNDSQEITPDRLAAMVANLGTNNIVMEPETDAETVHEPVMAEDITGSQKVSEPSSDEELDDILKAMDIDDILGDSVEDLDIDKILEVPLSNDGAGGSNESHVMSSEEIAALIANTDLLSEPEPAKKTSVSDLPDLSDPSHVMSSDEIAALLANM